MCGRVSDPRMGHFPPGCGGTPRTPPNPRSPSGVGASTPCAAVSPRGVTVFVLDVLDLRMYRRIYDPGMGSYYSRVAALPTSANQQSASGVGDSTPCWEVSTRGGTVFVPVRRSCRCVERFMIRGCGLILPGCGGSPRTPVNQRSTSGVGVVTPCAAVSIREISFSFPVCWEL